METPQDIPLGPRQTRHEYFCDRLQALGMFDGDSDYNGMIGHAVEMLSAVFGAQHHSGGSATITVQLFNQLMDEWESR